MFIPSIAQRASRFSMVQILGLLFFTIFCSNANLQAQTVILVEGGVSRSAFKTSSNVQKLNGFELFPNPASDEVNISVPDIGAIEHIRILDAYGKIVFFTQTLYRHMNCPGLRPGQWYTVEVRLEHQAHRKKLWII